MYYSYSKFLHREINLPKKSPHIFRGSFSAVWTATIARKDAFFSIFRDLQDLQSFAPLKSQNFSKKRGTILVIKIFEKMQNIEQKIEFGAVQKCANLVDLEKC